MATGALSTTLPRLAVHDPARGDVIAELAMDDAQAVADAVTRARTAQPVWAAMSVSERGKLVKRARKAMVRVRREIIDLLERETGKARFDVAGELMGVCMDIGHLARHAPKWLRTRRVGTWPLVGKRGL